MIVHSIFEEEMNLLPALLVILLGLVFLVPPEKQFYSLLIIFHFCAKGNTYHVTSFFHDTDLQGKDITRIVCTGCALKNF